MAAHLKSVMLARSFNILALLARRNGPRCYSNRTTQPERTLQPEIGSEPISPFVGHNFKYFNEGDGVIASHKADVNGAKLNFEVAGTGNKYVLMCPGALGSARLDFSQQLDNLNKDIFTLIGWDPRGYGFSQDVEREWPLHFLERDAHDAAKLMEHLTDRPFSLLGWSDGGMTAMILAAKYPNNIRKLVIWGANAFVTEKDIEIYEQLRDIDSWSERMRSGMVQIYGRDRLQQLWNNWIDSMKRYLEERKGDICKEELAKIKCPTLIFEGGHDAIVPHFHAEHLSEHIKNSTLVKLPKGKHNLHIQLHHEFNSIVEAFLIE